MRPAFASLRRIGLFADVAARSELVDATLTRRLAAASPAIGERALPDNGLVDRLYDAV